MGHRWSAQTNCGEPSSVNMLHDDNDSPHDPLLEMHAAPASEPEPATSLGPGRAPTPPSRRASAARPGVAGPQRPTPLAQQHGVTVPRPALPPLLHEPAVVFEDPGATLPPLAEREAAQREAASPGVATDAPLASSTVATRRRPPVFAVSALVGCVAGTAIWLSLLRPAPADAAATAAVPAFLQEASPESPSRDAARSTLPPALAATLAQALPPPRGAAVGLADAGAATPAPEFASARGTAPLAPAPVAAAPTAAASPALPAAAPVPPPDVPSVETRRRADELRAALELERAMTPKAPGATIVSNPTPPAVARRERSPAAPTRGAGTPPRGAHHSIRATRTPRAALPSDAPSSLAAAPARVPPLVTYTYSPESLYPVATAPMRVTDLVLEPGEKLVSQPNAGDAARWLISVVESIVRAQPQTHVFVKPLRAELRTNLTLTTDRRTYFLELSSVADGRYMAGVTWIYPGDAVERRRAALAEHARAQHTTTSIADVQALRFNYRITTVSGSPSWLPSKVFDDGQKTIIQFPRPVDTSNPPILFVLRAGSTRDATYVNYRIKRDLYVLERLVDAAELREPCPDGSQHIVRITRQ